MSVLDRLRSAFAPQPALPAPSTDAALLPHVRSDIGSESFTTMDLNDPYLIPFLRNGTETSSGATVTPRTALFNTTCFRCIDLIASAIGMLPLKLRRRLANGDSEAAEQHPLYDVLYDKPNGFQTAFEFRSHMQAMVLIHDKGAFARIIWGVVGPQRGKAMALIPLDPARMTVKLESDWTVTYKWRNDAGQNVPLQAKDVFHLRGLSTDGVNSLSRVQVAKEAIGLAQQAERASGRLFSNGSLIGGALQHKGVLSDEAHERLKSDLEERYSGAENAHRWMILEEGMEAKPVAGTSREAQTIEQRKHQVEEIARVFGVPRPLVGMDDTSWGSGIEQLSHGFVRYGLAPWFVAWEQAIARCLLSQDERKEGYYAKFNAGALLRGSMKDQAEFFARALGSGGGKPWMTQNEVREAFDQNRHPDGDDLDTPAPEPVKPDDGKGDPSEDPTPPTGKPKEGDDAED
jgi:HK97 family phage portal protein